MTGPRVCWGGKGELASYLLTGTPAGWKGQWSKAVLSHKPVPRVCLDIDAAETVLRTSRERVWRACVLSQDGWRNAPAGVGAIEGGTAWVPEECNSDQIKVCFG